MNADKKLTVSEIVKALECCVNEKTCKNCPYSGRSCMTPLKRDTLDLINHLQAENESLNLRIFALNDTNKKIMDSQEVYWQNKVKEFADRLKEKGFILLHHKMILSSDIDNLLKELGDNNESKN
jgi:hypothetical protein